MRNTLLIAVSVIALSGFIPSASAENLDFHSHLKNSGNHNNSNIISGTVKNNNAQLHFWTAWVGSGWALITSTPIPGVRYVQLSSPKGPVYLYAGQDKADLQKFATTPLHKWHESFRFLSARGATAQFQSHFNADNSLQLKQ